MFYLVNRPWDCLAIGGRRPLPAAPQKKKTVSGNQVVVSQHRIWWGALYGMGPDRQTAAVKLLLRFRGWLCRSTKCDEDSTDWFSTVLEHDEVCRV